MVKEDILTFGSKRYMMALNRYGKADVIDQVRNHTSCEVKISFEKTHIIVTDKYLICTGSFIVSFNDLELFDLSPFGTYRQNNITAFDNAGHIYTKRLSTLKPEDSKKIYEAVTSRLVSAQTGLTPATYLDYKRRHADDLLRNAREVMSGRNLREYKRSYLYGNPVWIYVLVIVGLALVSLVRLIDADTPLQAGSIIFMSLFLLGVGSIPLFVKSKTYKAYKAFLQENGEEVLEQINNKIIYTPDTINKRRAFVTEKYLVLIGESVMRREDVLWISGYIHKGTWYLDACDKDGNKIHAGLGRDCSDWMQEELMISSLLPNSVVFSCEENRKYYEERCKRQV